MTTHEAMRRIAHDKGAQVPPDIRNKIHRRGWGWYVRDNRAMVLTKNGRAQFEAIERRRA